jgi:hypothetical protein
MRTQLLKTYRVLVVWFAWLILCIVAFPASTKTSTTDKATLVLHDFTLIDGSGAPPRSHMTVLVRSEKITKVVPSESFHPPTNSTLINGKDKFLIPGLWDSHVHLSYGDDAMLGVLVANGVTTVRDMGGDPIIGFWRNLIHAGKLIGPHIFHCGPLLDGPKPFVAYHLSLSTPDEAMTAVRFIKMMGVDFIKVHTAVPRDSYFAIARESARLRIPFVGHVPMGIEPTEAAEVGQHSVEHIATIFEGKYMSRFKTQEEGLQSMPQWIAQEGKKLADIFAEHRTWFTPTVVGYEVRAHRGALAKTPDPRTRYTAPRLRSFWDQVFPVTQRDRDANVIAGREKFVENGLELTRLMYQAKVGIIIGTDLGVRDVLPGFSVHDEI